MAAVFTSDIHGNRPGGTDRLIRREYEAVKRNDRGPGGSASWLRIRHAPRPAWRAQRRRRANLELACLFVDRVSRRFPSRRCHLPCQLKRGSEANTPTDFQRQVTVLKKVGGKPGHEKVRAIVETAISHPHHTHMLAERRNNSQGRSEVLLEFYRLDLGAIGVASSNLGLIPTG